MKNLNEIALKSSKEIKVTLTNKGSILLVNDQFQNTLNITFSQAKNLGVSVFLADFVLLDFFKHFQDFRRSDKLAFSFDSVVKNRFEDLSKVKCTLSKGEKTIWLTITHTKEENFIFDKNHMSSQKFLASRFTALSHLPSFLL